MNVDIRMVAVIRNQESEALSMRLQSPAQKIHPFRHTITVIPGQHDPAVLLQLGEQVLKRLKRSAVLYRKMADQLIVSQRFISGFPHEIK
ncbi:hypothetical protein D3C80_2046860 [compost metagenome]